jgi:hypothetical protein
MTLRFFLRNWKKNELSGARGDFDNEFKKLNLSSWWSRAKSRGFPKENMPIAWEERGFWGFWGFTKQ